MLALFRGAFPDAEFVIEGVVAGENGAAVRWTLRGKHEGEWAGIPT
jgi:predicted ester cyclase